MSKSRLGKGLDALLSSTAQSPQNSPSREPATDKAKQINADAIGPLEVAVGDITPSPYQPRREFDEEALAELAASIAAQGVLQPLVVRTKAQGGFELIAGERRWRAAGLATTRATCTARGLLARGGRRRHLGQCQRPPAWSMARGRVRDLPALAHRGRKLAFVPACGREHAHQPHHSCCLLLDHAGRAVPDPANP